MADAQAGAVAPVIAPVRGKDRIAVIDVLRGIAILGIFFVNVPVMAGPITGFIGDIRTMGWSPADQSTWLFMTTFLEGTQRCLLEMLFGAGLMVTASKAMDADGPVGIADLYIRRNLWLLAFGLLNLFGLLWMGDILHIYALCALALFPFRKLRVRWLLVLGLILATLQLVFGAVEYVSRTELQQTQVVAAAKQAKGEKLTEEETEAVKEWKKKVERASGEDPEVKAVAEKEAKARAGSMGDYAGFWIETYIWIVGKGAILGGVAEAFGTMLIGIALWKLGFIQGQRSTKEYLVALVVAYGFGLTARYVGGLERMMFFPAPKTIWLTQEYARLAVTIGHIALVNLLMQAVAGRKLLWPFLAAGQTAFTLYLMQSFIGVWVLYSPIGLHLPGAQGWAYMALVALGVVVFQIALANIWMHFFVSGPLEWVWRSLAYVKRQPFRRRVVK
jgi:uncharacterized protein